MSHPRVGLLLATGGQAMVQAAYRSGTPAIGVGPGNAPALISADADLRPCGAQCGREQVVRQRLDLRSGKPSGRRGERARAPDRRIDAAGRGRSDTQRERARFETKPSIPQTGRFTSRLVGQDAATLARLARIERPYAIQLLVVPTDSVAAGNYLAAEKLAPVASLFTVADTDDGIDACRRLLEIDGTGHTAIIHTRGRRPQSALRGRDAGQPHHRQLPGHARAHGNHDRPGAVADARMRHVGRQFHDQQRHLQGPAEHQARRLFHARAAGERCASAQRHVSQIEETDR